MYVRVLPSIRVYVHLCRLASFMGIANSFEQYPRDWNQWFTSAEPENTPLPGIPVSFHLSSACILLILTLSPSLFSPSPSLIIFLCSISTGEWENSCNELQRMLIVRSMRSDRVPFCVTTFIINNLGSKSVHTSTHHGV